MSELRYELWNLENVLDFCRQDLPVEFDPETGFDAFKGFSYFDPEASELLASIGKPESHRAIVALDEDELVGILFCQYLDMCSFWRYHVRFIDVRDDHKNKGIATQLIRCLDKADFIKDEILHITNTYSWRGELYLKHIVEKELKARDYALILYSYRSTEPPEIPGIYANL